MHGGWLGVGAQRSFIGKASSIELGTGSWHLACCIVHAGGVARARACAPAHILIHRAAAVVLRVPSQARLCSVDTIGIAIYRKLVSSVYEFEFDSLYTVQ